jgi:hypothetical protein
MVHKVHDTLGQVEFVEVRFVGLDEDVHQRIAYADNVDGLQLVVS